MADSDCGAGAHCGFRESATGAGVCLKNCAQDGDCRTPAYQCFDFDGAGTLECAPVGTGTGRVGDACRNYGDCSGGQGAVCFTVANQNVKDGYCTHTCSMTTSCPTGSHCDTFGFCLKDCTSDGDCRGNGYACYDADGDMRKDCWSSANGAGAIGAACAGYWDCAGGPYGDCFPDPSWPGGYCTLLCEAGAATCASGSECVVLNSSNPMQTHYCLDECANVGECRSGYRCADAGGSPALECIP
jgi:hypothetical protein